MQLLFKSLRTNWQIYFIEAWALGMFMVSAGLFVILIEHPALPIRQVVDSALMRRLLIGLAMGITAVLLIYSPWGKRSGAHMNPAVTLTFLHLDRISRIDAFWYILFQFIGGYLGVELFVWLAYPYISHPTVNYVVTLPGRQGGGVALLTETILSFILIVTILFSSNSEKTARFTGYFAGIWLMLFITFTAPISGMSINPARTFASALPAHLWTGWWIYFVGPIAGMMAGGFLYRRWYRLQNSGDCTTMRFHLSGNKHDCKTYEVLGPKALLEKQKLDVSNHSAFVKNNYNGSTIKIK